MKKVLYKLREIGRNHLKQIALTKKSPHTIALGFGLGTFLSILPTPGFSVMLGVLTILFYKNISKYALFGAMALFNPLVLAPIYVLSYKLGLLILGTLPVLKVEYIFMDKIYHVTMRTIFGSAIIGAVAGMVSYGLVRYAAEIFLRNQSIPYKNNQYKKSAKERKKKK
jgi:uncharacterized protein